LPKVFNFLLLDTPRTHAERQPTH